MSENKVWTVIYEGTVREEYRVMAASEEEARERWSDEEPVNSEVIDGDVTEVMEVPADE